MSKKMLVLLGTLVLIAAMLTACQPGPQGPEGPQGAEGPAGPAGADGQDLTAADLTCAECHNDTLALEGKIYAWEGSKHGTAGMAWEEEAGNPTCAGCHEGSSFVEMIAAGQNFTEYPKTEGLVLPDGTPQTCRTCHTIHTTYTTEDYALRTTAPVAMVISGETFDKGAGNLCVNCHQARRYMANFPAKDASGNVIEGQYDINVRFNPHLSNQSDMLLGVGGGLDGNPAGHYTMVENSCVTCHLGDGASHTFDAQLAACQSCHSGAENFDINGKVTEMQAKFDELQAKLLEAGKITETHGSVPTKGVAEADAFPIWVYGYILEDASMGVHNPNYTTALLDAALEALK